MANRSHPFQIIHFLEYYERNVTHKSLYYASYFKMIVEGLQEAMSFYEYELKKESSTEKFDFRGNV